MRSENVTRGLRESSAYTSERKVVISNVRSVPSAARRFAPIVPKRSPCSQIAFAQPSRQAFTSGGRASVVRS